MSLHEDPHSRLILQPSRPAEMQRFVIEGAQEVRVGRSSGCEVHLPQESRLVSRSHARVHRLDGAWRVIDESRWGTFIGNTRLQPGEATEIHDGDRIRFGDCEFIARTGPHAAAREDVPSYRLTSEPVDLAKVDAARVLRSSLALPEQLGRVTSEGAIYETACAFLLDTLSPAIAQAYIVVVDDSGDVEVLGSAPSTGDAGLLAQPVLSKRVLQRLAADHECAVFLHREQANGTIGATVPESTCVLGASLLEVDSAGRATVLYAIGEKALDGDPMLVAQYLRLVATLVRQHLVTLRRAHLRNYLSPRVVELLCQKGGSALLESSPRLVHATSLFFDVRGSSAATERAGQNLAAVYDDLQQAISIVTECVFQTEGTVIDYAGDGVFASWGVPTAQSNQAALAIECGLRIVRRLQDVRFTTLPADRPLCGVGIAGGEVISGAVGSRIIRKFGILGPSVNVAHRLATLSTPIGARCRLLVTADVLAGQRSPSFEAIPLGSLTLQGMSRHEEVFELKPIEP